MKDQKKNYIESCWNEIEKNNTRNANVFKKRKSVKKVSHVQEPDEEVSGIERFFLTLGLMCLLFIYIYVTSK